MATLPHPRCHRCVPSWCRRLWKEEPLAHCVLTAPSFVAQSTIADLNHVTPHTDTLAHLCSKLFPHKKSVAKPTASPSASAAPGASGSFSSGLYGTGMVQSSSESQSKSANQRWHIMAVAPPTVLPSRLDWSVWSSRRTSEAATGGKS